jgi:RNA-binding protein YhbY
VRVGTEAPLDRKDAAVQLAAETQAVLAQILGRTFLLYKKPPPGTKDKPRRPKIALPA